MVKISLFRLQKIYLSHSRRDLVSKFGFYKNVYEISSVKYLDLSFLKVKKKTEVLFGLGFLFLISNKKGRLLLSSRKSLKKSFGCFVKLKNYEVLSFIEKFLSISVQNVIDFEEGFSKKSFSNMGTFAFFIKDIFSFPELGDLLFKFRNLSNLSVVFNFSSKNKNENLELLRSFGFNFM